MAYECDGCERTFEGQRVVFSTEATDDRGVDVAVVKRWVTCPACGDEVFARLGRRSPWQDGDGRTYVYPDEDTLGADAGFFAGSLSR